MSYSVSYTSAFDKDIKGYKKSPQIKSAILEAVKEIIANPAIGESLTGSWTGYTKYSFYSKPQFRIIYHIYDCCRTIEIIKCDKHADTDEKCIGLIDFVFAKTREECNNLYSKDKKYAEGFDRF